MYSYTARNGDGGFVAGTIKAGDRGQALEHLRTRSLFVTSLEDTRTPRGIVTTAVALLPVSGSARIAFFRSFATLIGSGVPMRRALEVTIEQCRDGRLAEALRSVASDIESGIALSAAMLNRPREFSRLFIAMIKAGEIGGTLDDVLERLAEFLERDRALRKRVTSALAYPAIVAAAASGLVLFLVANTVPAFAAMFSQMHVTLPASTRLLIALGDALKSPPAWIALLAAVPSLVVAARALRGGEGGARMLDRLQLALPVFGSLARKATIARFSRTLGTLLRSGVTLMSALDAARDVVENALYRDAIDGVSAALREGDPISVPLAHAKLFDPLFLQLVHAGEETGTLDAMLMRLAQYYELDVETAIATLGSIIEPLLIIFLGVVVGTIVASILVPLYSVIGSIT